MPVRSCRSLLPFPICLLLHLYSRQKQRVAVHENKKYKREKNIPKAATIEEIKHLIWMAQCMEADITYTSFEADCNIDCIYFAKSTKGKDKDKDDEVYVPIKITVGVTLSLCGLFLLFVPIPVCKTSGWYLLDTGMAF
jgi:hypothetical protein